jgi:hypothetical protein
LAGLVVPGVDAAAAEADDFAGLDLPGEEAPAEADDFAGLDLPGEEAPAEADDLAGLDLPGEEAAAEADDFAGLDLPGEEADEAADVNVLPPALKNDLTTVLTYMDSLLEALPDEKIAEFAHSKQFEVYKKLFKELGIA